MNELLGATNMQQDRLNRLLQPGGSVSHHANDTEQQNTASSPPSKAHSGSTRTRRNLVPATASGLGDEPTPEYRRLG